MKFLSALLLLITAASVAFAQDIALNQEHGNEVAITKNTFLLRYQKHDFNATADVGIASSCLLVYPDGKFRFERERQEYNDRQPITHVYEGQVDGNDLARLRDIVNNQDFRSVRVIPQGNTIRSNESFTVDVLRGDGAQRFMITDDTRRKYDKPLKPFLEWERALEHRKVPENKGARANGCQFPRRIQMPVGVQIQDPDQ